MLAKLREKILPEAKDMLTRVGKGEGSNYPSSIAKVVLSHRTLDSPLETNNAVPSPPWLCVYNSVPGRVDISVEAGLVLPLFP